MRPPIGVVRCTTARRGRTPCVSSLVPNAITRSTHRDAVSVEDNSPAGRRANNFTAAVLDTRRVGRPANDASVPSLSTGLIMGLGISNARLKQNAQAQGNWREWSHRDFPVSQLLGLFRSADAALSSRLCQAVSVILGGMLRAHHKQTHRVQCERIERKASARVFSSWPDSERSLIGALRSTDDALLNTSASPRDVKPQRWRGVSRGCT